MPKSIPRPAASGPGAGTIKNQSTEDYLKGILKLQDGRKTVSTSALAKHLNIEAASVTGMMKKLAQRKLIRYEPYRGVSLTETGRNIAVKMMRRHRLWEIFLTKHLGFGWDEIHEEAERLEHATSDALEARLSAMLGDPDTDPHGQPVPSADGRMIVKRDSPLSDFSPGAKIRITRVSDDSAAVLKHASQIGLTLGAKVTIREKRGFDGSMVVGVGRNDRQISREVAGSIFGRSA